MRQSISSVKLSQATSLLLAALLTGWQVRNATEVCVYERVCVGETRGKDMLQVLCVCLCVCVVPVFGEVPERLSEHSILAVSHG